MTANRKVLLFAALVVIGVLLGTAEVRRLQRLRVERLEEFPTSDAPDYGCASDLVFPELMTVENRFTDITSASGVDFSSDIGPLGTYFMPESTGAGVAFVDFDQDGRQDLYFVNSGPSPGTETTAGPSTEPVRNRLYRQLDDGTFSDVTDSSGTGDTGYGGGVAVGDVNNDGYPDIFVTNYGQDGLYVNNRDGTFDESTERAGIQEKDWGTCAAMLDYDRDGWLDLVVVNYTADPQYDHSVSCGFLHGMVSYCGPHKFHPTIDRLYHNETARHASEGAQPAVRFRDVTSESGLGSAATYGFGVVGADFTGDGWPDIFVANDGAANRLWVNQKDGTFREEATLRGIALNKYGHAEAGMGVAAGDVNGDLIQDLVVSHLSRETTTIYAGTKNGLFRDLTDESGLDAPSMRHTGWGIALRDLNHDGHLDLAQVNGLVIPCHSGFPFHGEDQFQIRNDVITDTKGYWESYSDVNLLMLGEPGGTFFNQSLLGGDFCTTVASGRGLATGDLDNDGDIDFVVTHCGSPTRLYRNDLTKRGHWLQVRLLTGMAGRDAIGAKVTIETDNGSWSQVLLPQTSYLSSHAPLLHFGLGSSETVTALTVEWPDGPVDQSRERFVCPAIDQLVTIRRGAGISETKATP